MHVAGDHVDGRGNADAVIDSREKKGLCAAARGTGGGDAAAVRIGERLSVIDHTERVPELHAEGAEGPELVRLGDEIVGKLTGIAVADHIPGQHQIALGCKIDGEAGDGVIFAMGEAALLPVAVGSEDNGEGAMQGSGREIEFRAEEVAGESFDQESPNAVAFEVAFARDLDGDAATRRQGIEAGGGENLPTEEIAAKLPGIERSGSAEIEAVVGVKEFGVARVLSALSEQRDSERQREKSSEAIQFDSLILELSVGGGYPKTMRKFAWCFVGYLVLVILFGAWVRIAGAGAGCGNHWPTCQGVVVPVAPSAKTMIEFTHRVTSALSGLLGVALLLWAWRTRSKALPWALGMVVFLILEGLIGAVLVKKELVAGDASVSRAIVISLHLANTMLLMLCAVGTAVRAGRPNTWKSGTSRLIWVAMAALVLTNMTGAVTALGDTLFPTQAALGPELLTKIREDIGAGQNFLVRLRVLHPVMAGVAAAIVFGAMSFLHRRAPSRWALAAMALVVAQVGLGLLNVALAAPGWMQIAHLAMAQLLWICVVAVWLD